jgi:hypothetical protein
MGKWAMYARRGNCGRGELAQLPPGPGQTDWFFSGWEGTELSWDILNLPPEPFNAVQLRVREWPEGPWEVDPELRQGFDPKYYTPVGFGPPTRTEAQIRWNTTNVPGQYSSWSAPRIVPPEP